MAKRNKKTDPKEFDDLWNDRVMAQVDLGKLDFDDSYTVDDIIREIDEKYPLAGDRDHQVYQEMGDRSHDKIQENLAKWADEHTTPEEQLTDEQEAELSGEAKKVFSEDDEKKFKEKTKKAASKTVKTKMEETGASEEDREAAADKAVIYEKLPEAKRAKRVIDLNRKLIKAPRADVVIPEAGRVKTFRARGWYDDVLDSMQAPKSSYELEAELKAKGIGVDMKPGILARRIRNLTSILRTQGYAEFAAKQKTTLTPKGKRLLKQLKKEKED